MKDDKRLKILYKDESGNLDLGGSIGKCDIYITNNINKYGKTFTVISKNREYCYYFDLYTMQRCGEEFYEFSRKHLNTQTVHKKVYNYITKTKDDNGKIKWINMINSILEIPPYNTDYNIGSRINNTEFGFHTNDMQTICREDVILDGEKFNIDIKSDYKFYPIIHVHASDSYKIDCLIRLDTLKYFGGDRLNKKQKKDLMKFLSSPNINYRNRNFAQSLLMEWNGMFYDTFHAYYVYDRNYIESITEETEIK